MQRFLLAFTLVALGAGLTGVADAQTRYDLANYLQLTPGKWLIEEGRPLGQPNAQVWKVAIIVQKQGPYIARNEFHWDGKNWVLDVIEFFEVKASNVFLLGDFEPVSGDYTLFSPPVKIPRSLKVNEPVTYSGLVVTPKSTTPVSIKMVITADKITKTVKAGTFTNCIQFKFVLSAKDYMDSTSNIMAPGHGIISYLFNEVDETEPESSRVLSEVYQRSDPKKP